ncbi:MAG: hypothetical protein II472_01430, partial [Lachnospiraceae bacterium]|nr:hypothetical protein [Lachnospiraceae bacterium]
YTFGDRPIYKPDEDYTNAVCLVSIYPTGNNKHIDVYWKKTNGGTYVGDKSGPNDPAYSIRINLN